MVRKEQSTGTSGLQVFKRCTLELSIVRHKQQTQYNALNKEKCKCVTRSASMGYLTLTCLKSIILDFEEYLLKGRGSNKALLAHWGMDSSVGPTLLIHMFRKEDENSRIYLISATDCKAAVFIVFHL